MWPVVVGQTGLKFGEIILRLGENLMILTDSIEICFCQNLPWPLHTSVRMKKKKSKKLMRKREMKIKSKIERAQPHMTTYYALWDQFAESRYESWLMTMRDAYDDRNPMLSTATTAVFSLAVHFNGKNQDNEAIHFTAYFRFHLQLWCALWSAHHQW